MKFQFVFDHAPEVAQKKFQRLHELRERPDFHPEESAAKHIEIVTNRCIRLGDPNLIMTGFFHDIFKAECARMNPKTGHPTSPGHDRLASEFIKHEEDVQHMIRLFMASPETVAWLCEQHMRIAQLDQMRHAKQEHMKSHPHFHLLEIFHVNDNMLISDDEAFETSKQLMGLAPTKL